MVWKRCESILTCALLVLGCATLAQSAKSVDNNGDCSISIKVDLPTDRKIFTPVILIPHGRGRALAPVDKGPDIIIPKNSKVYLSCATNMEPRKGRGEFTNVMGANGLEVTCTGGKQFTSEQTGPHVFNYFSCKNEPESIAKARSAVTEDCRASGGDTSVDIGFEIQALNELFPTMEICYNNAEKNTLWSKFHSTLGENYEGRTRGHTTFQEFDFFKGLTQLVSVAYDKKKQPEYFPNQMGNYLNRGHLTANGDFALYSHRVSTFAYINVAPQWESINSGSWLDIEKDVQEKCKVHPGLTIITGTHGKLISPVQNGLIFLSQMKAGKKQPIVPAPKYFWKIVHDPKKRKGVAIIGVNNPFLSKPDNDYKVCDKHLSVNDVHWITPWSGDYTHGYYYVCAVNDASLQSPIPFFKRIDVRGGVL